MADTTKKAASKQPSDEDKAFNARQESAWKAELNNIKELQKAGVKVGVTTNGVKPDDLRKKFDLFLQNGYEEKELVSLLTRQTAEILGLGAVSGDLKKGMQAHFTLMNKPFKDSKATVQHHVVAGKHKNLSQTDTSAVPVMRRPRTLEVE
jgi:imidazolonepropionase-like amidohydrolase